MMTRATATKGAAALRRVDTQLPLLLLRLWRFSPAAADEDEDEDGRRAVSSEGMSSYVAVMMMMMLWA